MAVGDRRREHASRGDEGDLLVRHARGSLGGCVLPIAVGESRLDLAQDVIGLGDDVIIDLRDGDTARRLHRPEFRQ